MSSMMQQSKPKTRCRRLRVDWDEERARYVAGTESFADVARRICTTKKAIEKHALSRLANGGRTWGELRTKHRADLAKRLQQELGDDQVFLVKQINVRRAQLALNMLNKLLQLDADQLRFRDLLDGAKLGIDPHLQIAGSGDPLEIDLDLEPPERGALRKLIESVLGRRALTETEPCDGRAVCRYRSSS
jgi:hypothetical protein